MLDHSALLPIFIDSSSKLCDKFSRVGKHQVVLNARIPDKNIVTPDSRGDNGFFNAKRLHYEREPGHGLGLTGGRLDIL
jgi:hypothetical protein